MSSAPRISVVVPTHNRAALLPDLLGALASQTFDGYEVIVVDDASTDRTPQLLAAWAGEGRTMVRTAAPSGSYAARNMGWRAAQGEIIAFTDDDCRPNAGWLTALWEAMQDSSAVGVQGMTVATPGRITPFTHQIEQRAPGPPYRTCNIAYRRSLLVRSGGFDDGLRWYADNILGYRARGEGPIAWAPDAVVHHPPRPREWRDRAAWQARFVADAVHRQELRRLGAERVAVPGRVLPVILWIVRPLLKQSMAHLRYAAGHPLRYAREVRPMVREKLAMLAALSGYWRRPSQPPTAVGDALDPLPAVPLVSVVIVTRDRPALLLEALRAVTEGSWRAVDLIVVDHGSDAQTRIVAEEFGARYVRSTDDTLAAARQRGVDAATGEIVAFTDDDCRPRPDWLARLVAAFRAGPRLCGVQGRTVAEAGTAGTHAVCVSRPSGLYETCNIAYRREALIRAGGFDLRFSGWFEDTTLATRILEIGEIGWASDAVVVHRAMPRRPLDRTDWRRLLRDERRFATSYPTAYRRTRGPAFLPTVVARWGIGSPVKTLWREAPHAAADPSGYLGLAGSLVRERTAFVLALTDVLSEGEE